MCENAQNLGIFSFQGIFLALIQQKTDVFAFLGEEIVKPESEVLKSKVPKYRPKGLGLTLKSHGPPLHPTPPTPPITFKHEGVLW